MDQLKDIFRQTTCYDNSQADWDILLPEAVLEMNSQMNKPLKASPFSCTFGKDAILAVDNSF